MKLETYASQLHQETLAAAEVDGLPRVEAFTSLVLERLSAAGEVDSPVVAHHRKTGVEVSGWGLDEDRGALSVAVTDWSGEAAPRSLTTTSANQFMRRLV